MKHILIDFENVQPEPSEFNSLYAENCHIWLFLGKLQQKTLPVELCEALCRFGSNVHFIRIGKTGKNALDFYLTYYLGKITTKDNSAVIYILSRDSGFDVLVEHLLDNNHCGDIVRICRLTESQPIDPGNKTLFLEAENSIPAYQDKNFIGACRFKVGKALRKSPELRSSSYNDLLSVIYRTILKQELEEFDETIKRDVAVAIIAQLLEKKVLMTDSVKGELTYCFINAKQLTDLIVQQVTNAKPKTLTALHNVIRNKSLSYYFESTDDEINQLIQALKSRSVLKQNGDKIIYAPFEPVAPVIISGEKDPEVIQKANRYLTNWKSKRPANRKALTNAFKSHLKLEPGQIAALIRCLEIQKKIAVSEADKITYNL